MSACVLLCLTGLYVITYSTLQPQRHDEEDHLNEGELVDSYWRALEDGWEVDAYGDVEVRRPPLTFTLELFGYTHTCTSIRCGTFPRRANSLAQLLGSERSPLRRSGEACEFYTCLVAGERSAFSLWSDTID
jgi:hypothetical protein